MRKILPLLSLSGLCFAQSLTYSLNVGASPIQRYRPVQITPGTVQVIPATPATLVYGISATSGSAFSSGLSVTALGTWVCEFDSLPTVGDSVTVSSGSLCSSLGATAVNSVPGSTAFLGVVSGLVTSECPTCAWVNFEGPNHVGAQVSIPSGLMTFKTSGTCDSGWTEVSSLSGVNLLGTTAGAGDVGTTGGTSSITPSGSVSTPTFTGSSAVSSANGALTLVTTDKISLLGILGSMAISSVNASATSVAAHTHTLVATGSVSTPTFSGASFDPRGPFRRVIFCSKN